MFHGRGVKKSSTHKFIYDKRNRMNTITKIQKCNLIKNMYTFNFECVIRIYFYKNMEYRDLYVLKTLLSRNLD